jgi:threonylcarbamoyladenosine tRNA methylthiotransferase MtaB
MYRRYRPWHYAEKLAAIRALLPDAAIGADVMIGFPGETDALFQESYDFIAAQPFTYLHLFPFSARPGTPAWELHRQNPVPTPSAISSPKSPAYSAPDSSAARFPPSPSATMQ